MFQFTLAQNCTFLQIGKAEQSDINSILSSPQSIYMGQSLIQHD